MTIVNGQDRGNNFLETVGWMPLLRRQSTNDFCGVPTFGRSFVSLYSARLRMQYRLQSTA